MLLFKVYVRAQKCRNIEFVCFVTLKNVLKYMRNYFRYFERLIKDFTIRLILGEPLLIFILKSHKAEIMTRNVLCTFSLVLFFSLIVAF